MAEERRALFDCHFPVACHKDESCYHYRGWFDTTHLKGDTQGRFFSSFFAMVVLQLLLCSAQQFSFLIFLWLYFLLNYPSLLHFSYLIPHFPSPYPQDETKMSFLSTSA